MRIIKSRAGLPEERLTGGVQVPASGRSVGQSVSCRPATLHDYEQIHALERRYSLGFRSYEEWSHLWVNNPVYRRAPELPIGWVLEDDQRRIVGSIGSVPFGFELDGRQLIAATSSGWVADTRYRAYALLLLERLLSQPGVDLYLCVSPNAEAEPAVALQAERVPVGVWNRTAFWITDSWSFVGSALAKRQTRFQGLLRVPAWGAIVLHRACRRDALKTALRQVGDRDVRTCTAFDERFDDFWETVRAQHPHRLLATRTRDVLEWHFRYPLARNAVWIYTVGEGNRLLAYAVFCRKDVAGLALRRVRLLDYQSLDGDTSLLLPMLAEALARCRREGTAVLESIGWRLEPGDLMHRIAPYSRTMPSWQYFYKAGSPALANVLKDPAVWSPSQYDGDACI